MVTATDVKYIVQDPDIYGGKPCIAGHRIAVHNVATWHHQGQSPENIVRDFQLSLAQVYAALTYYYDHQQEIDAEIEWEREHIRARAAADTSEVAQRLREAIRRARQRDA